MTSLPAAHAFGALLEGPGQGMVPRPEQELATLRGACEDKLQGTHKPSPALGKKFRELLLPCRHIRHGEIVLAENPPNPPARKQVTRVVSRAHRLLQGTKEDRLVFASTTANPAKDRSVFIPVCIDAEVSCTLVDGALVFKRSEEHTSELQSRLHLVCRLLLEKKKK